MVVMGDAEKEERETDGKEITNMEAMAALSRREKRKALKKIKRKQVRREMALKDREEKEVRLNDPEEQMRLLRLEKEEAERMERGRVEFQEREKRFLQALEELQKKKQEEKEQHRMLLEESQRNLVENEITNEFNKGDDWEYVEEGPAEIIWKGNEIIVKKKKVRVPKKVTDLQNGKQEDDRPSSNPLAPQSEAFEDYRSAQDVLESVAQQVPNFGTEQDKEHCPFHLKTGVCRFGARCSRVHFYPDKSCTLLMKNMYNGPGLAWVQDEGLETVFTDEEVERSFEDFYEDVHAEFLKFGEIINFKVCKNGSSHLRGNVYVHYKLLESAVLAYQSVNGRYFAGRQVSGEFVNVMRWKVAICGEYMKSRFKTCSRGSACNFIHCFRNPGGDYEWADWDKPAPRYWQKKMAALFGSTADRLTVSPRYRSRRSRSRGSDSSHSVSCSDEDDDRKRGCPWKPRSGSRDRASNLNEMLGEKINSPCYHRMKRRKIDSISDGFSDDKKSLSCKERSSRKRVRDSELMRQDSKGRKHEVDSDKRSGKKEESDRFLEHNSRSSMRQKRGEEFFHDRHSPRYKVENFVLRESPDADKHHDKYRSHKGNPPLHQKREGDSSEIDSHGDRLDRDNDRRRMRSKKSSRQMKNEAKFSDSSSDGNGLNRDEKRPQKSRSSNSRSKNYLDSRKMVNNRECHERGKIHHVHRKKSCRHHSEESGFGSEACRCHRDGDNIQHKESVSDSADYGTDSRCRHSHIDSRYEGCESEKDHNGYNAEHGSLINRTGKKTTASEKVEVGDGHTSCQDFDAVSEAEQEQAYRLAALKKLEEIKKSKDSQHVYKSKHVETSGTLNHDDKDVKDGEITEDCKELSDSGRVETSAASRKRKRM